jgi:neutral amino acid transport system permease protein
MQNIVFGLITGSILALATVGFSMIRQTEGFINIAHGQFLALGAFLGLLFADTLGWSIWIAGPAAAIAVGLVGVVLSIVVFRPIRGHGALVQLFSSVGLAYVLYGLIIVIFGARVHYYPVSFGRQFQLGSILFTMGELLIVALAAFSVLALHVFLTRTSMGMWVRAVASNPNLARVRGVQVDRVSLTVWYISTSLAGLAGVMLGVVGAVNSELGWVNILLVLAAAVLGGFGSIYGVIAAGLLLGLVMDLSAVVIPTQYRTVVAFAALVLVLVFRPEGLFSLHRRRQAA